MSSEILKEVFTAEASQLPNISIKISELANHINDLKSNVKNILEDGSVQFNPLLKENNHLKSRAIDLIKEMTIVQEEIETKVKHELTSCADELKNLSSSLKEINLFLATLKKLMEINLLLKKSKESMDKKNYYECADTITTLQELVQNNKENLKQIEIFKVLSQEVVLSYEQLMYHISEIWSQCISICLDKLPDDTELITIAVDINSCSLINEILKASDLLKSNLVVTKFSENFLNSVLHKITMKHLEINVNIEEKALLTVKVLKEETKPYYLSVFGNLKLVINFFKSHIKVDNVDNINFLSRIGNIIAKEFADCLIKNCLSETIPTSSEDLEKYKEIVKDTADFEKHLQQTGFLPEDPSPLLDYAKNINVLFANKFCQSYLEKARIIMKKDLHNVIQSKSVISDVNFLPVSLKNLLREKMNIHDEIFSFPMCQISKQADELMSLINVMMMEIQKSSDLFAVRLFYTVRNIFEMYTAVVPLHHKKFLETLPHQVAIFHNNCMYFAHNLIYLVTEYYKKFPSLFKEHFMIFLNESVVLRSLAVETLELTVTNQRNQLIYIIRDSAFATLNTNPTLSPNSEKTIRQLMRQLQILEKVWVDVLPLNVYNRAIGFLLDAIVEELTALIISVEDISSQTASDLESNFNIILEKGPSLFPESKEIHRHTRKWQKFKEFVLVLKGSLRDIDDRWANGMGPLAVELTAEQVKHLIRALFQNSERRAALLARIR